MRAISLLSSVLVFSACTHAQYLSEGWTPGQAVPSETVSTAVAASSQGIPPQPSVIRNKPSFIDTLLDGGPFAAAAQYFGFNVTGGEQIWDARIALITDRNYQELIVDEPLTEEEEKERVWFLLITATFGSKQAISKHVDDVFDATYNMTLEHGDLPHVRFGRIDYLNVTAITTKWMVWTAPYLVVLKDRGQTLRFYKAGQMRLTDELLYEFLKEEVWKNHQPWKSIYGPGGKREFILDFCAQVLSKIYDVIIIFPKWLLYLFSGTLASFIISFLHKAPPQQPAAARPKTQSTPPKADAPSVSTPSETTQSPKKAGGSSKHRKGGKK